MNTENLKLKNEEYKSPPYPFAHPVTLCPMPLTHRAARSQREMGLSMKFIMGLNWSRTRKTRNMRARWSAG